MGLGKGKPGFALLLGMPDLISDFNGLPTLLDGGSPGPLVRETFPQPAQSGGFASPVSDVAGDGQGLLVVVDGGGDLSEVGIAAAGVAQVNADGPGGGEVVVQTLVQGDGEPVMAPQHEVVEPNVVEHVGGGVVVLGLAAQVELGELGGEVVE